MRHSGQNLLILIAGVVRSFWDQIAKIGTVKIHLSIGGRLQNLLFFGDGNGHTSDPWRGAAVVHWDHILTGLPPPKRATLFLIRPAPFFEHMVC